LNPAINHRFRRRDHFWRVQSDERGCFDEIVVRKGKTAVGARGGLILHAEMMNERSCFVEVAGLCIWVTVKRGIARIAMVEDRRTKESAELPSLRDAELDR
jgi:hypothetical protein